jgi:hypothetical protein
MNNFLSELKNKKILYFGPGNTSDKSNLNINDYDYVIITNMMIDIFHKKYDIKKPKIIGFLNHGFTQTYPEIIKKQSKYIYKYIFVLKEDINFIKKYISEDKILLSYFVLKRRTPLGLPRALNLLEKTNFKELYITGVTFYQECNLQEVYADKEYIDEPTANSVWWNTPGKNPYDLQDCHKLNDNIEYTKKICQENNKIILCEELKNILYK